MYWIYQYVASKYNKGLELSLYGVWIPNIMNRLSDSLSLNNLFICQGRWSLIRNVITLAFVSNDVQATTRVVRWWTVWGKNPIFFTSNWRRFRTVLRCYSLTDVFKIDISDYIVFIQLYWFTLRTPVKLPVFPTS